MTVLKVELLGKFITKIQETLFQNPYKAKYLLFLFLKCFFFLKTCINNALKVYQGIYLYVLKGFVIGPDRTILYLMTLVPLAAERLFL